VGLWALRSGALVAAVLVVAGCGGSVDTSDRRGAADTAAVEASDPQGRQAGDTRSWRFVPATHAEGHSVVLPVTFTDGTSAELVYPRRLAIAALGLTPYGSATLRGKSAVPGRSDKVGRDFLILHGEVHDYLARSRLPKPPSPITRYQAADGQSVGLWNLPHPEPNYLGFQFGPWAVLVYDYPADEESGAAAMTDAERAAWSASFSGRETADGFLLLRGSGPLRLARAGETAGPQLSFGSVGEPPWFALYPGPCKPHRDQTQLVHGKLVSWSPGFASWCLSDRMRIHARGRGPVIEGLIRGLAVRDVTLADS
jgi:hypothetical protein